MMDENPYGAPQEEPQSEGREALSYHPFSLERRISSRVPRMIGLVLLGIVLGVAAIIVAIVLV